MNAGHAGCFYFLPVQRLSIQKQQRIGHVNLHPAGQVNVDELFSNTLHFNDKEFKQQLSFFKNHTLLSFTDVLFHPTPGNVSSNESIVTNCVEKTSYIVDYLRYKYCKLSNFKLLTGRVGQVSTGETLVLMYTGVGSPFTRILQVQNYSNVITSGNGLFLPEETLFQGFNLQSSQISEVGHVAKHALRMYSAALEENTATGKFIAIMRLFEFIANPTGYEKFKDVRKKIAAHIAKNSHDLERLADEFKYFSSGDNENGLRTQIIHNGKNLNEMIPNEKDVLNLLRKLQDYVKHCVDDLINNYDKTWAELENIRKDKTQAAISTSVQSDDVTVSETVVLLDANCLNDAIERYHPIFKQLHPDKNLSNINILNLCYQILSNARLLERDKVFGLYFFYNSIEKLLFVDESLAALNDMECRHPDFRVQLHTIKLDNEPAMIKKVTEVLYSMRISSGVTAHFENLVFCGDRKEYEIPLTTLAEQGNIAVTVIKDPGYSEMEISLRNFDVGHLVGMSLGLDASEL